MLAWVRHHSKASCVDSLNSHNLHERLKPLTRIFSGRREGVGEGERRGSVSTNARTTYLCTRAHTHITDLDVLLNCTVEKFQHKETGNWFSCTGTPRAGHGQLLSPLGSAVDRARVFSPGCRIGIQDVDGHGMRATERSGLRMCSVGNALGGRGVGPDHFLQKPEGLS